MELEQYYQSLEGRNAVPETDLARKLDDRLSSILPLAKSGDRILEIGCAEGDLGAKVKRLTPTYYAGVELSGDARRAEHVLDKVIRTPATSLRDELYDLILAFHVLEHIPDLTSETMAWQRLLTPGGAVIVETPNGAGHALLSWDSNPEHIHQFSCVSLAALVQRSGFDVIELTIGHFESPIYTDSIRLVARPTRSPATKRASLLQRFRALLPGTFAIYGIGGDFRNYVLPLIDDLPVAAVLDTNPVSHGRRIGNLKVCGFDSSEHGHYPILIASYRYETEIRGRLIEEGADPSRLFCLTDIYGSSV